MQRPFPSPATSTVALALLVTLFAACSSQPSKYKRKKDCDCPKWNRIEQPGERGIHAIFGHEVPPDLTAGTASSPSFAPLAPDRHGRCS
jgi:hypothetical protein